jgi:hypothetical protein
VKIEALTLVRLSELEVPLSEVKSGTTGLAGFPVSIVTKRIAEDGPYITQQYQRTIAVIVFTPSDHIEEVKTNFHQ